MQKKFILVGLKSLSLGWDFFKAVLDSLERYSVDLTHIDHVRLRFETPHTKTWFVFEKDRSQWYDGIRADAIFGSQWKTLLDRATKDTFIAHQKGVGLVEYICQVEKEAEKMYRTTTDMCVANMYPPTLYRRYGITPKKLDPELFKTEPIEPLSKGTIPDELRVKFPVIDEWSLYKDCVRPEEWPKVNPYLMSKEKVERIFQEGNELMKKEGENNMNNIINTLAMNKNVYLVSGDVKAPVQINSFDTEYEWGSYVTTCNCRILTSVDETKKNPNTKLPGIKTVHFSGPVTAVIWADKTKTIVRCNNENVDYEKGLAMAIAKKALGTNKSGSNYYDIFKKWLPKDEKKPEKKETKTEEKPKKKKTKKGDKQDG